MVGDVVKAIKGKIKVLFPIENCTRVGTNYYYHWMGDK